MSNTNTCWGCREDQPNQLAHMDIGGCLYSPSDDELEIEAEVIADDEGRKLLCFDTVKTRVRKKPERFSED